MERMAVIPASVLLCDTVNCQLCVVHFQLDVTKDISPVKMLFRILQRYHWLIRVTVLVG